MEKKHNLKLGTSLAKVAGACVLLILLAGLAACDTGQAISTPSPILSIERTPVADASTPDPISTATATIMPTQTPSVTSTPRVLHIDPLRSNPSVGLRASDIAEVPKVVGGTFCTPAWSSTTLPTTLALPVEPVSGDLLLEWNSSSTSDYISSKNVPTYGLPANYTIATSADSTDGSNGTWRVVVTVTNNTARTRAHRFPFAGAHWVRMTVTSVVPGPLGDRLVIDQIELYDASKGTDDSVFFMGDSITVASFTRCPGTQPSFAQLVRDGVPGRSPAMIDGGVAAVNSSYGVAVIQDWLALNPDFHIWAIGYGTNDAWQKVDPAIFQAHLQFLVEKIEAAGRIPVIARIPFALKGPADADVRALNNVIDQVTFAYGLPHGPDLYSWFSSHTNELGPDGVHPTDTGSRSINRLWYDALRPLYATSR